MPVKLLTSGGGGVNLVPSSSIASDQTMYLPTSGTSGGTVLCTDSTGGTANGVLYLNGNKQVTSSSGLVFDGSNLGIGTGGYLYFFAGEFTDTFTLPHYGLAYKDYSGGAIGPSACLTGYGGIRFYTSGTLRGQFTNSGNLGIGTASPAGKIDVINSGIARLLVGYNGSSANFYESNEHIFRTGNSTERMRIDPSGNLGIGTSSPVSKLDVRSGVVTAGDVQSTHGQVIVQGYYTSGDDRLVTLGSMYSAGSAMIGYAVRSSQTTANSFISTADNSNFARGALVIDDSLRFYSAGAQSTAVGSAVSMTERARIDSSGNLLFSNATYGSTNSVGMYIAGRTSTYNSNPLGFISIQSGTSSYAAGDIVFGTTVNLNSVAPTEKMRLSNNGNLGIGTSSPGTKLTVVGTNTVGEFSSAGQGGYSCQVDVRADNAAGSNAALYLECPGIIGGGMYILRDATQLRVWCGPGTSGVSLTSGATSWGTFSDERLKDIIEPITDAASKVSKLRSVIGKFKTDEEGKRRAFLIAQDVKAVLPEAVYKNSEADDTLSLAYTDVIPLLVAAIKEQQALIESLTQRIEALEYKGE